jgi:hypothetical protein
MHQLLWDSACEESEEPAVFQKRDVLFSAHLVKVATQPCPSCSVLFHPMYHNGLLPNTWAFQPEWVHIYHLLCHVNHMTHALNTFCVIGGIPVIWAFVIHFPAYTGKNWWKAMSELLALLRITSVDYEFSDRKWFISGTQVPFCPNHLPPPPPFQISISHYTFSPLFTSTSALYVQGFLLFSLWLCLKFTALAAAVSEEHSCAAICKRKHTIYNIHVKLDLMHRKKRGTCVIDIAHAIQIP